MNESLFTLLHSKFIISYKVGCNWSANVCVDTLNQIVRTKLYGCCSRFPVCFGIKTIYQLSQDKKKVNDICFRAECLSNIM